MRGRGNLEPCFIKLPDVNDSDCYLADKKTQFAHVYGAPQTINALRIKQFHKVHQGSRTFCGILRGQCRSDITENERTVAPRG